MAATYEPIASTTLGSDTANVTFSGIASDWTDLVVVASAQISDSGHLTFRVNGDTSSNYSSTVLYGNGSITGSTRYSSASWIFVGARGGVSYQSGVYTPHAWQVMSYTNTNVYKTVLVSVSQGHGAYQGEGEITRSAGLWRSTSAVTSVTIGADTGSGTARNLKSGSTFSLYGIKAA